VPEPIEPLELIPPEEGVEDGLASAVPGDDLPTVVVDEPREYPLGRAEVFDFGLGVFVEGGRGPAQTTGVQTLIGWIDKALHTQEGALPIHPPGYGLRDPYGLFGRPVMELSVGDLENDLRACLTFHPRIADVINVVLERDPDDEAAYVQYEVLLDPPVEDVELVTLRTRLEQ
jgi:hypothetical protein